MRNLKKSLWVLLIMLLASCGNSLKEEMILGSWQGADITQEGEKLDVDPAEVRLNFLDGDSYTYHSTLDYREAGTYFIDARYLFTTDTMNQASTKKAVEIIKLTQDSLMLKMNEGGNERLITFVKVREVE